MILIKKDLFKIGYTQSGYHWRLDDGLSKETQKVLKQDLLKILKEKGLTNVNKLNVSLNLDILTIKKTKD